MRVLDVVLGLHFYQPPTQREHVLHKIARECYRPLLNAVERSEGVVTIDICASLIEQLRKYHPDILATLLSLVKRGKVALVNTAAYHPLLPLVPHDFMERQLAINERVYRECEFIAEHERVRGVFPPEMACSPQLLPVLHDMGYRWVVSDDEPYAIRHSRIVPFDWIPKQDGIRCVLRSRLWSDRISHEMPEGGSLARRIWNDLSLLRNLRDKERTYLILWMDAETFGHHHKDGIEKFLIPFFAAVKTGIPIRLTTPDDLINIYPAVPADTDIPPGSWSTSEADLVAGIPYPLWLHPDERWHHLWWQLASLAIRIASTHPEIQDTCDKALYSCQTWWMRYPKKNKDLFLWAVPWFELIVDAGTPTEQTEGYRLIHELENA